MKAFLSHSSEDKEFVQAIARELGRQFCVFDEYSFETGEELKKSIEQGIDESSIFVLFASRKALDSVWVEFEEQEAWFRRLRASLTKSLVYIIHSSIQVEDIPEWLRRGLVKHENSPRMIGRDIRHHLDTLLRERQHIYFVGRSRDVEELEQALTPLNEVTPPHAIFVTGLPGIGRRSLIRNTTPTLLHLRKHVEIRVGEGDSINDISISVADHSEPYSTKEGFERIVGQIRALPERDALHRTLANLRSMVGAGELPVFVDEGGLLDEDGSITDPIRSLIQLFTPNDDAYMFLVSTRRPQLDFVGSVPVIHLRPLRTTETRRLVTLLVKREELEASTSEVAELADYVAGYPPAAYFAVQQAKNYGLDLVLRNKSSLVQFRMSVFLRHLDNLSLSNEERTLLRLLATHSPLPLPVIAKVVAVDFRALQETVVRLIDLALIITTQDGYYRIADPVADAAANSFGFPSEGQHKALAKELYEFLRQSEIEASRLELSRVLFRAARLAKDNTVAEATVFLANDLIRLTETFYHGRRYEEAVSVGYTALEERPDSSRVRGFIVRALIQVEKWQEAEIQIDELRKHAPLRDVHFLMGFLERKRGKILVAIDTYKKSKELGRRGSAINRELAICYFLTGDLEQASIHIDEALKRYDDDGYVVDVAVQIATRKRDEPTARKMLERLKVLDKPLYFNHRLSRVELAFGRLPEARSAARLAVQQDDRPPFPILSQLVFCEIESGNLDEAEILLGRLDRMFANIYGDVRIGLRCRLEIARGRYSNALAESERIVDKTTASYRNIRRDSLGGELTASALRDSVRADYENELSYLGTDAVEVAPDQFLPDRL